LKASKRYWISAVTAGWNSTSNWSATSGGSGGSSVPGSNDTCYFDSNGPGRCDIDANVNVKRFEIVSTYTDTITQNAYTLTVGSGGMTVAGAVFIGSSSAITVSGTFTNSACNFKSTSGTFEIKEGHFSLTGTGAFLPNNGLVKLFHGAITSNDTCKITLSTSSSDKEFYDIQFDVAASFARYHKFPSGGMKVNHLMTVSGSGSKYINAGTIELSGDYTHTGGAVSGGGLTAGILKFMGTGSQYLTCSSSTDVSKVAHIDINKSSGTLYFVGSVVSTLDLKRTAGSLDAGTSRFYYRNFGGGTKVTGNFTGSNSLNKLYFIASDNGNLTIDDTLQVNDSLVFSRTTGIAKGTNAGILAAKGHINIAAASPVSGSMTLLVNGSGKQVYKSGVIYDLNRYIGSPNIRILKSAGDTLKIEGFHPIQTSFNYVSGVINSSAARIKFSARNSPTITGSVSLRNVEFCYGLTGSGDPLTIASGTQLTIIDSLLITGTTSAASNTLNTGIVNLKGNMYINCSSPNTAGTATIKINGTGDQHIYGNTASGALARLPNVEIDKASGTLYLHNNIATGSSGTACSFTHTAGTLDYGTSTLVFANNCNITSAVSGNRLDLYNVQFTTGTIGIHSSTTLGVNGDLSTSSSSSALTINGGTIECKGNITINNTNTSIGSVGSVNMLINGIGNQTFTGSGISTAGFMPKITINKSSGTLYLASIISAGHDWTYTAGTVDATTYGSTVYFGGTHDADAQGTSATMSFHNAVFAGTRTLTGDLKAFNNLTINSSSTLAQGSYTLGFGGYANNGTHSGSGNITLIGNGYHEFSKSGGGTTSFGAVTASRSGGSLKLNSPVNITTSMSFTKGIIKTTATNLLKFADNATCTGGSDSGYVKGPVIKTGNDVFVFPLGDTSNTAGPYHPLNISAPASGTDAFTAEYFYVAQTQGTAKDSTVDSLSTCQYWHLARTTGSSNVHTGLQWKSTDCTITPADSNMRMVRWNSTKWIPAGDSIVGTKKILSNAALSSFGYLTLAQHACHINSLTPFAIVGPYGICSGKSVDLTVVSGDSVITYLWSTGSTNDSITSSPTVNTTYSVTGTFANGCARTTQKTIHVFTYDQFIVTTGFDTILAPDTLFYTISTKGLMEDSIMAEDTGKFCADLPITETSVVDLYFYSKALTDTLHIQYDVDTAGIISGLRFIEGDNLYPLESEFFSTNQRHLVLTPIVIIPKLLASQYHKLKRELDGGFLLAKNKRIFFSYEEEYNNGSLNYRILNSRRVPLTSLPSKVRQYGTNQYSVVFPSNTTPAVYYLEVTNAKGENFYMRFKLL
jgi:hypothetical protein